MGAGLCAVIIVNEGRGGGTCSWWRRLQGTSCKCSRSGGGSGGGWIGWSGVGREDDGENVVGTRAAQVRQVLLFFLLPPTHIIFYKYRYI
jgi:hypothetical protein